MVIQDIERKEHILEKLMIKTLWSWSNIYNHKLKKSMVLSKIPWKSMKDMHNAVYLCVQNISIHWSNTITCWWDYIKHLIFSKLNSYFFLNVKIELAKSPILHKKWIFSLKISSVNVTKFAVSCGFGHIYWRNP